MNTEENSWQCNEYKSERFVPLRHARPTVLGSIDLGDPSAPTAGFLDVKKGKQHRSIQAGKRLKGS